MCPAAWCRRRRPLSASWLAGAALAQWTVYTLPHTSPSASWRTCTGPELLEKIPVKKFCTPEEIAHTVEYLISPLAGFVTVRYSLLRFSLSPNQHVHLCGLVAPVALEISFSLAYMYTNHAMRCYSCGTG
jgi:hypothetical protein